MQLNPSTIGPGFYSSLFLVEKRSGGWRPILNQKRLNEGVKPPKFKMDTLQSVLNTLGADIKLYRDGCRPAPRYRVCGPFPWICRTLTSTSLWIQGTRSIFASPTTERPLSFRSCRSACQPLPEPLRVWSERWEPISRRWESIYSSISTTGSW